MYPNAADFDLPERPQLRNVDAFPAQVRGEQVICLRDPAAISDGVLTLPAELVPLLSALDGSHSIPEIQAAETRRRGTIVMRGEVEEVVRLLDDHLLLASPRFAAAQAKLEEAFRRQPTRGAFHAGAAYPSDPAELRQWLDSFFVHPDGPGPIRTDATAGPLAGVLVPHIDFQRGGPAYAWAYRALAEAEPADVYVVLGVPHQGVERSAAATLKSFETPLGTLDVERDFVEALQQRLPFDLFQGELRHRTEHSIEFEAVFLRYLFPDRDIRFVPILPSFVHELLYRGVNPANDPAAQRFIQALGETIDAYAGRVCLIGGVDLAHVGPQFGDPTPVTGQTLDWLAREDGAMLSAVESGEPGAFFETIAKDRDRRRVCGLTPIYTIMQLLGREGTLLKYGQAPDPHATVTFASVTF